MDSRVTGADAGGLEKGKQMKGAILNHFAGNFLPFYDRFLETSKAGEKEFKAVCPFHEDKKPSLNFNAATGKFYCHGCQAGGDILTFYGMLTGLDPVNDFPEILKRISEEFSINGQGAEKSKIVKTYEYLDEKGDLLFQVCRLDPKSFRQRRPDGNGSWSWNLAGIRRVLYRLQEVIEAREVILVEGEKDADRLCSLGFTATTNPGGAGKWRPEYSESLRGKDMIFIPDHDGPGKKHVEAVSKALTGIAASIRILTLPDLPEKGDVSDFLDRFEDETAAAEKLSILIEDAKALPECRTDKLVFINAADWLETEPEAVDQIFEDTFDAGDKVTVIGSSKLRKTFFLDQMLLSLAAGRPFLKWRNSVPRRIVLIQFEIRKHHKHRRIKRLARAMGIKKAELGDRFHILNARGLGITGPEGLKKITPQIMSYSPDVIAIDPLYKLTVGAENTAEDSKVILNAFDVLAEKTGAAVLYVHHDSKGTPGDRDIRDRGAGSNVLGRDYDACFVMTAHAMEEETVVVETLLRNYRPQEAVVVQWSVDEGTGIYFFIERPDCLPSKKTSQTAKKTELNLETYLPFATEMLTEKAMPIQAFKDQLRRKTGMTFARLNAFMSWVTAGGKPILETRSRKGRGVNEKWIGRPGVFDHEKPF